MNVLTPLSSSRLPEFPPATAATKGSPASARRLLLASAIQMAEPAPELIPGFLDEESFAVLYARPGACKSFLAQHLALGIATGTAAWGHQVRKRAVLYLSGGEGVAGLRNRLDAWTLATETDLDDALLFLCPTPVNLTDAADTRTLAFEVAEALNEHGTTLALVVVDTLNRNFGGSDENAQGPMADFVRNLDWFRKQFNAAALVVHHTARGGSGPRGSSVLDGAADTMMEVAKGNDDKVRLVVTKQKDGEDDVVAVFQRETVALVPTTHRRKRSSLFLRFIGHEKRSDSEKKAGPEDGLSDRQRQVLGALRAANGRPLTTRDILDTLQLDEVPERATRTVSEALKALAKRPALGVEQVSKREWRVSVE
jgi:hypothetical protein